MFLWHGLSEQRLVELLFCVFGLEAFCSAAGFRHRGFVAGLFVMGGLGSRAVGGVAVPDGAH